MTWASSGSILLSSDWQYTEPIPTGSYIRLKHTEAPNGGLFAIAQCEVDETGKLSLIDSQVLAVEKPITDVLRFPFPGCFAERRIAIKKLPKQPSLQQELRRLFLPGYLQPTEEEIRIVSRSNWKIDIEASDFVEATNNTGSGAGSGGTNATRPTDLNSLAYAISALENYAYYQTYTVDKINNNDPSSGVMKVSGGTTEKLKLLVSFDAAKTINKITIYPGQFNNLTNTYYNAPAKLEVYGGNGDSGKLLLTATEINLVSLVDISTLSNSNFAQPLNEYTFVFTNPGNDNISINELDLFGA